MTQRALFVPSRRVRPCRPGCPDCRSQKSRPPKPEAAAWMAERYQLSIAGLVVPVGRPA